jgi:hypothetical protein
MSGKIREIIVVNRIRSIETKYFILNGLSELNYGKNENEFIQVLFFNISIFGVYFLKSFLRNEFRLFFEDGIENVN